MNTRSQSRFDYKIFHETGDKVLNKGEKDYKMGTQEQVDELKLREDIKHALRVYPLDELETETEILEFLGVLNELSQKFRHFHIDLQNKLALENYSELYPDYEKVSEKLYENIKKGRKQLKIVRNASKEEEISKNGVVNNEQQLKMYLVEVDFLDKKVSQFQDSFNINDAKNVEMIDEYLKKMEGFLKEYFHLSINLKCSLGEQFGEYEPKILSKTKEMTDDMKMANILKIKLLEAFDGKKREESINIKQKKAIIGAQNLSSEIDLRCEFLEIEYNGELGCLSDYQILEISQNSNLDKDFNGVLEKVTAMGMLVVDGKDLVQDLLDRAVAKRDLIAEKRKSFRTKLEAILMNRDITPDKLKNASTLKVEIPKFSGYDSLMDFYTV